MALTTHIFAELAGASLVGTYDTTTLSVSLITLDGTNAVVPVHFQASLNGLPLGSVTTQPGQIQSWTVPPATLVLVAITGSSGATGVRLPDGITLQTWT